MYNPNKSTVNHINGTTPKERILHAIKTIADSEELYILENATGEVAYATIDNYLVLPLWPAKVFADQNRKGNWQSFRGARHGIEDFFDLIEKEEEKGELVTEGEQEFVFLISVHPVGEVSRFVLSVEEFMRDVLVELREGE